MSNTLLRTAIRKGLSGFGVVGASALVGLTAAPVFAQDQDASSEKLETVVVTGSRIRRVDIENASPVF
ncbi:MAG: hypothetical protein ABI451_00250, partial [Dokdonella sp.]